MSSSERGRGEAKSTSSVNQGETLSLTTAGLGFRNRSATRGGVGGSGENSNVTDSVVRPALLTSQRDTAVPLPREITMRNLKVRAGIEAFSSTVFVRFTLYHLLFPLSLPVVWAIDGVHMTRNLCFLPSLSDKDVNANFMQQLVNGCFVIALVGLWVIGSDSSPSVVFLVFPLTLYGIHKLMIGTKYAIMEDSTFEWLRANTIPRSTLAKIELSHWLRLKTVKERHKQLEYTATDLGIDSTSTYFYLRPVAYEKAIKHSKCPITKAVRAFYEEKGCSLEDLRMGKGSLSVLVRVPILPIANLVMSMTPPRPLSSELTVFALAIAQAGVPLLVAHFTGDWDALGHGGMAKGILILSSFLTCFFFMVAITFVDTARVDYQRRARVAEAVGRLIDIDNKDLSEASMFIDLAWSKNVGAWLNLRGLLLHVGSQYRARITIYSGFVMAGTMCLVLFVLVTAFVSNINMVRVSSVTLCLLSTGSFLAGSIWYGSATNDQYEWQARSLGRVIFKLREIRADMYDGCDGPNGKWCAKKRRYEERLKRADDVVTAAMQLLQHDLQVEPVRILGLRATKELYTSFATVLLGAAGTFFSNYYIRQTS
uniref:Uncharacterized protein n=1 Tax=Lotharella globosa TaxID=91324 RepID=A0A7S4DZN0_9EUKA